ncbi:protein NYNRIN-like [Dermacentor variabilis]|uniref:protein NYNRIN-like n=1 Tax=Dermacentor variabilis TaxID=34621 RepID=UPI003F5B4787
MLDGAGPEGRADEPPSQDESVNHLDCVSSVGSVFGRKELLEAQREDPFCKKVFEGLREPGGAAAAHMDAAGIAVGARRSETAGNAVSALDSYLLDSDGVLLRYIPAEKDTHESFKAVIPRTLRGALLRYFHDTCIAGHASGPKTYLKLCRFATWPGMKRDVMRYARSCNVCQRVKPRGGRPPGLMQPINSRTPWQIAACDVMGPYPRSPSGNRFLLVVTDHFSKWVELFPLRKLTARVYPWES